jgi:uncharacterized membrane protein
MKRVFELLNREQKLPMFAALFSLLTLVVIAVRGPLVAYHVNTKLFTTPFGVISSMQQLLLMYGVVMVVLVAVVVLLIKMDHRARGRVKDERQVEHEYVVTEKSYRFVLYGLFLYMIVVDTYALAFLLLCMMFIRIKKRQHVSNL